MANADNPFGLRPKRHKNGAPYNGGGSLYAVSSSAVALAPGDPVIIDGGADAYGIPTVVRATAGDANAITGVVLGRTNGEGVLLWDDTLNTLASTAGQYILVEDNPDVVYDIQCDATLAAAQIGLNVNLTAGTAVAGKSIFEADIANAATTATFQLKILRLARYEDNALGANAIIEVMINNCTQTPGSAGIS